MELQQIPGIEELNIAEGEEKRNENSHEQDQLKSTLDEMSPELSALLKSAREQQTFRDHNLLQTSEKVETVFLMDSRNQDQTVAGQPQVMRTTITYEAPGTRLHSECPEAVLLSSQTFTAETSSTSTTTRITK
ncbi:band 4.1-like protein 2, partial [Thalassophryne amazonica]|uniref:band 4.1-like protein 2 n=1 Tax=Thalassophryne amazonica TaxID=390379 RepID=UPI0014709290